MASDSETGTGASVTPVEFLELSGEIVHALGSDPSTSVCLDRLLERLAHRLGYPLALLWLPHRDLMALTCQAHWYRGSDRQSETWRASKRLAMTQGTDLPGRIWKEALAIRIDVARSDPDFPRARALKADGLESVLGFPLFRGTEVLGVIELFGPTESSALDRDLLAALGRMIGSVLAHQDMIEGLKTAKKRKRAILDAALDGIISIDHYGRVIDFNPSAERMFGLKAKELIGKDLAEALIPTRWRRMCRRALIRYFTRGRLPVLNKRWELRALRADGSEFEVEASLTRLPTDERGPAFALFVRDISEQARTRAELHRSHSLMHAVLSGTTDVIFVRDREGRYLLVNPAGLAVMNQSDEKSPIGKTDTEMFGKLGEGIRETDLWVMNQNQARQSEDAYVINGQLRTFFVGKSPYRDSRGEVIGVIGISRDISPQKRAEESAHFLAEASQVLATSLDYHTTLSSLAWLVVPSLADWCCIDILEPNGSVRRLTIAHEDPERVRAAWEHEQRYPLDLLGELGPRGVLQSGEPRLLPALESSLADSESVTENARLESVRKFGFRSYLGVPLKARGRTLGAISFFSSESGRRFGNDDLALALELGQRAAIAVDNARLYQDAQRARERADSAQRRAEAQYRTLHALTETSDFGVSVQKILRIVCETIGARLGIFWRPEDSHSRLCVASSWSAAGTGFKEFLEESQRIRFSRGEGLPGEAWKSGAPECWNDGTGERAFLRTSEARLAGFRSGFCFPLHWQSAFFGVLEFFAFDSIRHEWTDVQPLLAGLGAQIGHYLYRMNEGAEAQGSSFAELEAPNKPAQALAAPEPEADGPAMVIDPASFTVSVGGQQSVPLTSKEFQIVFLLKQASGCEATRSELVNTIWGKLKVSTNSLDVHLFNLRRKLAPLGLEISFVPPNRYCLVRNTNPN